MATTSSTAIRSAEAASRAGTVQLKAIGAHGAKDTGLNLPQRL